MLVGTYAREAPPKKELDEEGKQHLADLEKQMNEERATYEKAMEELYAKATKNPDWKRTDRMTREDMKEIRKLIDSGDELAVNWRESSGKLRSISKEIGQMKGTPKTVGRVWFFPRK